MSAQCRTSSIGQYFLILLMVLVDVKSNEIFKITRVECLIEDESFVHLELCRLKAIRRNVAAFSILLQLQKVARDVWVKIELLRKYNGYRPFLFNTTIDACKFIKTRNKGLVSVIYNLFGHFTNLNHTCPYEGAVIVDNFYPEHKYLTLPMPSGEYLCRSTWIVNKAVRARVNVWFTFEEFIKLHNTQDRRQPTFLSN